MFFHKRLFLHTTLGVGLLLGSISCDSNDDTSNSIPFSNKVDAIPFPHTQIGEASGMTTSKIFPNHLWLAEDSGNTASLMLISKDGTNAVQYDIPNAQNIDWEDIIGGAGPENGSHYLYIGDTGNNGLERSVLTIYRIKEFNNSSDSFQNQLIEAIQFRYPDQLHNTEALLVDPNTKHIYLLTKEDSQTQLYKLPYPQKLGEVITAEKVGTIPNVKLTTSASISSDGSEVILRTYLSAHYWKKSGGQSIEDLLLHTPNQTMTIQNEAQGEAIALTPEGIYTLSERTNNRPDITLNLYKRNK